MCEFLPESEYKTEGNPKKLFPFREKICIKKRKSAANLFVKALY